MQTFSTESTHPRRVFAFLVTYRWLSLLPPLLVWLLTQERPFLIPLLIAIATNAIISIVPDWLNHAVQKRPYLLALDLILMALLIGFTDGWETPFYLYALNPLLITAFFFGLRRALYAATFFLPLYVGALLLANWQLGEPINWLLTATEIVGIYLISGTFGYASNVVINLRQAQATLSQTHRDLQVIHDLTVSLQSASYVEEVQEKVLQVVTDELEFPQAIVGLVDEDSNIITNWMSRNQSKAAPQNEESAYALQVPLLPKSGLTAQALLEKRMLPFENGQITTDTVFNQQVVAGNASLGNGRIIPMLLREHSVGVLIVADGPQPPTANQLVSLEAIAGQAAVTMGATLLCIDRTRKLAVQDERLRIAQDIHDTVSQSLFGIVFTLDGCLKLLPDHAEEVIPELERALQSADAVRQEIRRSILDLWPATLTAERFTADLQQYAAGVCQREGTQFTFDIHGDFGLLSPKVRRSLYRISQEALANIAHHAQAAEARVCIDVTNGRANLVIRDDGQGFDTAVALSQTFNREHFGLRGIQERAHSLGGECHIFSTPGAGASIIVDIPV
ncbi:MAG: GAF domain-containing sensor histidine kinase [Ardenticatenaceae bacterium]|nr:GAF domain-containing sensor histidine kinase [Anaerolineales bacterium]MCB8921577.1 GAF domain-containing sensor histidine kinase [Ardenticatenaceae bacterium]MCB9003886.1 GAF domain-containing sensor histidine kinase [Ardenticatenaceae bacterium]